jgi:hypothetical protein
MIVIQELFLECYRMRKKIYGMIKKQIIKTILVILIRQLVHKEIDAQLIAAVILKFIKFE